MSLSVALDPSLQKSIQNKKISAEMDPEETKLRTVRRMFEQFFIIGAPPEYEGIPKPSILVSYPTQTQHSRQVEEVDLITSFCFPIGFPKVPPAHKNKAIINEYMFCLVEGSSKVYGIAVVFNASERSFFASEKSCDYPFALCMLTSTPFLTSHFEFLTYMALLLSFHIKPFPHTSSKDVMTSFFKAHMPPGLVKDEENPSLAVLSGIKGTKEIVEELDFYYSLPTSLDAANLQTGQTYPIIKLSSKMNLAIPIHFPEEENLAHASFNVLFSVLTIDQILKIYTAVLCEEHVVFVSEKMNRMTMCIMGIISLLKGFDPIATIILPVLPYQERFLDFFDSPCPYIVGTTIPNNRYDILINLDKKTITEKVKCPQLPYYNDLKAKIESIFKREVDTIKVPPKRIANQNGEMIPNPEYMRFYVECDPYLSPYHFTTLIDTTYLMPTPICDEILNVFANHLPKILEDPIKLCLVTDATDRTNPITVFNKDIFFSQIPKKDNEFFQRFMQTQIWDVFCDSLATEVSKRRKSTLIESRQRLSNPTQKPAPLGGKTVPVRVRRHNTVAIRGAPLQKKNPE